MFTGHQVSFTLHNLLIPEKVTPHMLRHTKAMLLLNAGVSLIYIRDLLGHADCQHRCWRADVATNEVYARVDTEFKRKKLSWHGPN